MNGSSILACQGRLARWGGRSEGSAAGATSSRRSARRNGDSARLLEARPAGAERGVGPRERRRWGVRRGEAPRSIDDRRTGSLNALRASCRHTPRVPGGRLSRGQSRPASGRGRDGRGVPHGPVAFRLDRTGPAGAGVPCRVASRPGHREPDRRRALHVLRRPGVPFRADDSPCPAGRGGLDRRHRRAACSRWRTGGPSDAERRILRTRSPDVPRGPVRWRRPVDHGVSGPRADHLRAGHRGDCHGLARAGGRRAGRCGRMGDPGDCARKLHGAWHAGRRRGRWRDALCRWRLRGHPSHARPVRGSRSGSWRPGPLDLLDHACAARGWSMAHRSRRHPLGVRCFRAWCGDAARSPVARAPVEDRAGHHIAAASALLCRTRA